MFLPGAGSSTIYLDLVRRVFFQFYQDAMHQPFLLTEALLTMYVAYLGKQNCTHQTMKCYLSAIWFLSVAMGRGNSFTSVGFPVLLCVL